MRIKAAVDARNGSGSDIVIVARTDSRQALTLDEAYGECGPLLTLEQMFYSLMPLPQEKK
jgi:hypothetical protein